MWSLPVNSRAERTVASAPRAALFWLALGLLLLYVTTSSGGFESSDTVIRYETARSWLDGRGGALPAGSGLGEGPVLPDGRVYAFYGPLQSLLMLPFLAAVRALPPLGIDASVIETFAISLVLFPLVSTAAMILLYLALRELGFPPRAGVLAVLALAAGSMFWYYARMGQEEHLVAFGFALWLFGAARLAGARRPATTLAMTLMATGALVAFATRWATVPQLSVLFVLTLILACRFRSRVRPADLLLGGLVLLTGISLLLWYNHLRFGAWLETGYQLWYGQVHLEMFELRGYGEKLAALLVSPYRGLIVYSPIVLFGIAGAVGARSGVPRLLAAGALAVLAVAILFFSAFQFWSAGHAWGPRFLVAPQVLLAPAFACLFAHRPRLALVAVPLCAGMQLFSVLLPGSTEEYVRFNLERDRPGYCDAWRLDCSAVGRRVPLALDAIANTFANRPGEVIAGRPRVAPEAVLETSDYRTIYWWPVRIAFRLGRLPLWAALLTCIAGLVAAVACLVQAVRVTREGLGAHRTGAEQQGAKRFS